MEDFIRAEHVDFKYEFENEEMPEVLSDVTLGVRRGEFLALLGHNGSGKSTLAKHFTPCCCPRRKVFLGRDDTARRRQKLAIPAVWGLIQQNPDNQWWPALWRRRWRSGGKTFVFPR